MRLILLLLTLLSANLCAQNCSEDCGSIAGISWLDENENGIRDVGEPGVPGEVRLLELNTGNLYTLRIEPDGLYAFDSLIATRYLIEFSAEDSVLTSTLSKQGDDPTRDSDPNTGSRAVEIVLSTEQIVTSDADIGWARGTANCSIGIEEIRPASCDDPTTDLLLIGAGIGQAEWSATGLQFSVISGDTALVENVPPGQYDFTVTYAATGCSAVLTYVVATPTPQLRIDQRGSFCTDSVHLVARLGNDTDVTGYAWSDGTVDSVLLNPIFGETYAVTVTFESGCIGTDEYTVEASEYNLGEVISYLDCTTVTDTFRLPAPILPDVRFSLTNFGGSSYIDITEQVLAADDAGDFEINTIEVPAARCAITGRLVVVDVRPELFSVSEFRPDSCLLEEVVLDVFHNGSDHNTQFYSYSFSGPADSFAIDTANLASVQLFGAQAGTYTIEAGTPCGDTVIFYDLFLEGDCGLEPNVSGLVRFNDDGSCDAEPNAPGIGIPNIKVRLSQGAREYHFRTDSAGRWSGRVIGGSYAVTTLRPADSTLVGCGTRIITTVLGEVPEVISPMVEQRDCAALSVDVTSFRFRRCFENSAYVNYSNRGSKPAENTVLKVVVDPLFDDLTATADFTREGDTLTFALGQLGSFASGRFRIDFTVSCLSDFGQLHCLEAEITADDACDPGDGIALLDVRSAGCAPDSLRFNIQNVGSVAMVEELEYFVYVDRQLRQDLSARVPGLAAGATFRFAYPATGETVQVVAKQPQSAGTAGAPYPSAVIESCGGVVTGNATQISADNELLGQATYCRTNTGSFDPNEKIVYPTGLGEEGDVQPGTRLTYELHFQNTGTDTAFTVVIRDTMPEELDLTTIEFGAASHDYEVMVDEGRALTFTFNDIQLVDSFTNVPGSMGVVSFTIDHDAALQRGDRFQNRAGIFFDFNEPILTEYARTRLAPEALVVTTKEPVHVNLPISLSPNPAHDALTVTIPAGILRAGDRLHVSDLSGRARANLSFDAFNGRLSTAELPAGLYVLRITRNGHSLGRRKFVVAH